MFKQTCPRCQSTRIQLGFNEAPMMLYLVGMRELLCNNCNLEFKAFVLGRPPRRIMSEEPEVSSNKRRARRFSGKFPVQVAVVLTEDRSQKRQYSSTMQGYTRDISRIGLAIIVPAIRIDGLRLMSDHAGQIKTLWVRLVLPPGPVTMRAAAVRCEALKQSTSYLIGVQIKKIEELDQVRYFEYLDGLEQGVTMAVGQSA